jgi:hypothetical protein
LPRQARDKLKTNGVSHSLFSTAVPPPPEIFHLPAAAADLCKKAAAASERSGGGGGGGEGTTVSTQRTVWRTPPSLQRLACEKRLFLNHVFKM